jgi:hypothetical protein
VWLGSLPLFSGFRFRPTEFEFVFLHIHAAPSKCHSFRLQAQSLFDRRISAQLNFAACAQYPLPWQIERSAQCSNYLPGGSGISGGPRYRTVG